MDRPDPVSGNPGRFRNEPLAGHLPSETLDAEILDRPALTLPVPAETSPPEEGGHPSIDAMGIAPPLRAGLLMIAIVFGGFGTWAAFAPLDSAAVAQGVVGIDSRRKTVQHLEGGIIAEILVREGSVVAPGDVLIKLDETQPRSTQEQLRRRLQALAALEARLIAERDDRSDIDFPDWLVMESGDAKVVEILEGQKRIFDAARRGLDNQTAILRQRIAQFREEIAGITALMAAEQRKVDLINQEIAGVKQLVDKGLERLPRLLQLQRDATDIDGNSAKQQSDIARARQNIGEAELRIVELRTTRMNDVVKELRDTQTQIYEVQERIRAAEDILDRTAIRAPVGGTVVNLRVFTAGGVIRPGEPLLDIVPSDDRLVVQARLDPNDIDVVHPGLHAQVRINAFNQRTTPTFAGTVENVSADRLVDERTGTPYYMADIVFDDSQMPALSALKLYPGMPAEVMIVVGNRTALEYIWRPLADRLGKAFREQ